MIVVEEQTRYGFNQIITGEYAKPDPQLLDSGYLHFKNILAVNRDRVKRVKLVPREASQPETVQDGRAFQVGQQVIYNSPTGSVNYATVKNVASEGGDFFYDLDYRDGTEGIGKPQEYLSAQLAGGNSEPIVPHAGEGAAAVAAEDSPLPAFQDGQQVRVPDLGVEGFVEYHDPATSNYRVNTILYGVINVSPDQMVAVRDDGAGVGMEDLVPHDEGVGAMEPAPAAPAAAAASPARDVFTEAVFNGALSMQKASDHASLNQLSHKGKENKYLIRCKVVILRGLKSLERSEVQGIDFNQFLAMSPAEILHKYQIRELPNFDALTALVNDKIFEETQFFQHEQQYCINCKDKILTGFRELNIDSQLSTMSPAEILDRYESRDLPYFDALAARVRHKIVEETEIFERKPQSPTYDRHYLESWMLQGPVDSRIPVTSIKKSACPVLGPDIDLGTLDTTPNGRPHFSGRIVELGSDDLAQYVVHGSPMQGNGPNKHDFYSGLNDYQPTCLIQAASVRHSRHGGIDQENFDFLRPGESEARVSCVSLDEMPKDELEQLGDALYLQGSSQNIEVRYLTLSNGTRVPQFLARQQSLLLSDLKLIRQYLQKRGFTYKGSDAKIMCGCKDGSDRSGRTAVYFHLMNLIETRKINLDEITLWDIKCIALQVQQQTHLGAAVSGAVSREMVAELTGDPRFQQGLKLADYLKEHPEFRDALESVDNNHFTGLDHARREEILRSHKDFPMEGFRHILGS